MFDEQQLKKWCEEGPEVGVYLVIDRLGGFIWRTNHDMADGRIPEDPAIHSDLAVAQKEIEFAVNHTTRFGVTKPRRDDGGGSEEYWKWFRWWDTYIKGLSDADFHKLAQAVHAATEERRDQAAKKIKKWRPKGDWRPK